MLQGASQALPTRGNVLRRNCRIKINSFLSEGRKVATTRLALSLAVLMSLAGCGLQGDRAAAIESCHATRTIFDNVPNPRAGQEMPNRGLGRSLGGPRYEPNFIRPTFQQQQDKIAFIRSRAASSRDRGLQERADRLRGETRQDGSRVLDTSEMTAYCSRKGY